MFGEFSETQNFSNLFSPPERTEEGGGRFKGSTSFCTSSIRPSGDCPCVLGLIIAGVTEMNLILI